jgi:hypothetical protein
MDGAHPSLTPSWPYVDLRPIVEAPPPLVGREAEVDAVMETLANRTPSLVLLAGSTGLGKSTFLREVAARAEAADWSVAARDDAGELAITPGTTPVAFARRLRGMLQLTGSLGAEATRLAGDRMRTTGDFAKDLPDARRDQQGKWFGKVVDAARRWLSEATWAGLADLVRDLERRAPLLIVVDGYCPSEPFGRAFAGSFLAALARASEPIVVILAEREELLADIAPSASTIIGFGPVDRAQVRRLLAERAAASPFPLTDEELDELADAAASRPELIRSVTRLLALPEAVER